jgi:hypothetical protein
VLYLRSLVVKNDALLELSAGGEKLRTKRLAHVQPSEMIRFGLEAGAIQNINSGTALEVALR